MPDPQPASTAAAADPRRPSWLAEAAWLLAAAACPVIAGVVLPPLSRSLALPDVIGHGALTGLLVGALAGARCRSLLAWTLGPCLGLLLALVDLQIFEHLLASGWLDVRAAASVPTAVTLGVVFVLAPTRRTRTLIVFVILAAAIDVLSKAVWFDFLDDKLWSSPLRAWIAEDPFSSMGVARTKTLLSANDAVTGIPGTIMIVLAARFRSLDPGSTSTTLVRPAILRVAVATLAALVLICLPPRSLSIGPDGELIGDWGSFIHVLEEEFRSAGIDTQKKLDSAIRTGNPAAESGFRLFHYSVDPERRAGFALVSAEKRSTVKYQVFPTVELSEETRERLQFLEFPWLHLHYEWVRTQAYEDAFRTDIWPNATLPDPARRAAARRGRIVLMQRIAQISYAEEKRRVDRFLERLPGAK